MDENRPSYQMYAPGADPDAGSRVMYLPSRDEPVRREFPALDDHLVDPEVTRDEVIGGRRVIALPAEAPHAIQHSRLDYVIGAQVADGYLVAADLLTRFDEDSDFASDTSVHKAGTDPKTGTRHLEEIAFEVVSTQSKKDVTDKAPRMIRRGVRRVFAVFVKKREVWEWSRKDNDWRVLKPGAKIKDRCLVRPVPVKALLDAAAAEDEVARGLDAKGNRVIGEIKEKSERKGEAKAVLLVLKARGLTVDDEIRSLILATTDLPTLERWLTRSTTATSAAEVVAED